MTEKDILKLPDLEGVGTALDDLINPTDERMKTQILIREGELMAEGQTRYVSMIATNMNNRSEIVVLIKKSKEKGNWREAVMFCGDDLKLMAFSLYGIKALE